MACRASYVGLALLLVALPAWAQPLKIPTPPPSCPASLVKSMRWGVATSAYQIEGGWNAGGKSPSIWDTLTQKEPSLIMDNSTGNVATDHFNRWEEDVALMKRMGVKHYRLSLAWTRIVPGGVAGSPINMEGIRFYLRLIKGLKAAGIQPAVTLYHWDLPHVLQDKYKGFLSPKIQEDFLYYADAVFKHLGPEVDQWMTFNEVISICELGYQLEVFAPQMGLGLKGKYVCGHNIILAHAKTVKLYRAKYAAAQKGKVSIALDGKWGYPYNPKSAADVEAAENFMVFQYAWIADPLYYGDYPLIMRNTQGDDLPKFTEEDRDLLRETPIDVFSVNFYCGYFVKAPDVGSPLNMTYNVTYKGPDGNWVGPPSGAPNWLFKTPDGLRKALVWLHKRYEGPEMWITENGVAGLNESSLRPPAVLQDDYRLGYYRDYLDEACKAITQDGVRLTTYYGWSFIDNFEWRDGFARRFGLVYVDLLDNLKRLPKASAIWYSNNFLKLSK